MISLLDQAIGRREKSISRCVARWVLVAACVWAMPREGSARACVWKVTSGANTLYLAGSVHALRSSDYPLPAAYDRAFQASSELAFETDLLKAGANGSMLAKVAYLPKGTTLRDHLDPGSTPTF